MEHDRYILENLPELTLDAGTLDKLLRYAGLIHSASSAHNLTGHKTLDDIVADLIVGSLRPFCGGYVPRGTSFLDIGTGAGIPGIPFAIVFGGMKGLLIDSNSKKIEFIRETAGILGLTNLTAEAGRAEELAVMPGYRCSFDLILSRAMASMYILSELGTGFLNQNGLMYLYARGGSEAQPQAAVSHAAECGLVPCSSVEMKDAGFREGVLLKKTGSCPDRFPRRYAVIKRESDRIYADTKSSSENIPLL